MTGQRSATLRRKYACQCFEEFGSLDRKQFAGFAIMQADGRAVFAFRGTLISSLHNWQADLEVKWAGAPPRHHGFDRAWREMEPDVRAWLERHRPKWITLTGHSLGGACATVAALDLALNWPIDELVVFGCPRVGSEEFATAYRISSSAGDDPTTSLEAVVTRYVKTTDLIARIPWETFGYCHVGACFYFNSKGEQVETPSWLMERVYALSDLQEMKTPNYGVLGRFGIDLTLKIAPAHSPVRLYGALDLLTRVMPGWTAMLFVALAVLLVDLFRHPMTGYIKLLHRQLERANGHSS